MNGRSVGLALGLCAAVTTAGCAHRAQQGVRPDEHVANTDSWLRGRAEDCPQPSCLYAVLVDTGGNPIVNANVEFTGSAVQVTSSGRGRIFARGIPLGSHRVRVILHGGETLESEPIPFGYTINTFVMEVSAGSLRIRN